MNFNFQTVERKARQPWDYNAVRVFQAKNGGEIQLGTPALAQIGESDFYQLEFDQGSNAIKITPADKGWKFSTDEMGRKKSSHSKAFNFPVGDYVPVPGFTNVYIFENAGA